MAVKLFLNSQTILNHTFPITHRNAYDAEEVDRFLDMVIQDYKLVEASVVIPSSEYELLKQKNKVLVRLQVFSYRSLELCSFV